MVGRKESRSLPERGVTRLGRETSHVVTERRRCDGARRCFRPHPPRPAAFLLDVNEDPDERHDQRRYQQRYVDPASRFVIVLMVHAAVTVQESVSGGECTPVVRRVGTLTVTQKNQTGLYLLS